MPRGRPRSGGGAIFGDEDEKHFKFAQRSLFFLDLENPARALLLDIICRQSFDSVILFAIALNSAMMAMEDPLEDPDNLSDTAKTMLHFDLAFTVFFTIEMLMKSAALGFVVGNNAYLRSAWNQLDAVVVLTSWLPYILDAFGTGTRIFRTFRLLRPLRSISRFPGLRRLVSTILMAAPQLQLVVIAVGLFFVTFGTVGVQLWKGNFRQRCHAVNHTAATPFCQGQDDFELCAARNNHIFADDQSEFCDIKFTTGEVFWEGSGCAGGSLCEEHSENPYFGIVSHDRIDRSFVIIMQLVTVTAWQEIMHLQMDTSGEVTTVYYVICTLLGGYFLLNLFVAVLKSKYEISRAVHSGGANVFRNIDDDDSGELDKEEVNRIFQDQGVTLTYEELTLAFSKMDKNNDGGIDIAEFSNWLRTSDVLAMQLRTAMNLGGGRGMTEKGRELVHTKTLMEAGLSKAQTVRVQLNALQEFFDWDEVFEFYDIDRSGDIDVAEFRKAIRKGAEIRQHQVSDEDLRIVFEEIDVDHGMSIDTDEFMKWLSETTEAEKHVLSRQVSEDHGGVRDPPPRPPAPRTPTHPTLSPRPVALYSILTSPLVHTL